MQCWGKREGWEENGAHTGGPIGVPMLEGKPDITEHVLPPTRFFWTSERGFHLHVRHWLPPSPEVVRGLVFFLHGYGGHVNRKGSTAFYGGLAMAGYAILAFEIEGHGYSPGERAFVQDFEDVLDDWVDFVRLVRTVVAPASQDHDLGFAPAMLAAMQRCKYALMGESMGGLLAILLASRLSEPENAAALPGFSGVVGIAPALAADMPPPLVAAALRALVVPLVPSWPMPAIVSKSAGVNLQALIRDEALQEIEAKDDWGEAKGGLGWRKPMKWATAGAFIGLFNLLEERMPSMAFPVLVMHDPDDSICLYSGSQRLMEVSPSKDKALIDMPGGLHDLITNERQLVTSHVLTWLAAHL